MITRAKDVLPNTDRTQAAVSVHYRHPAAATEWSSLLLYVVCSVRHTRYNALSMETTQQFSQFCPW